MATLLVANVGHNRRRVDIAAMFVAPLLLTGCPGDEQSANCAIRAPSADLVTFLDDDVVDGTLDPVAGAGILSGSVDAGFDWALAPADKAVLVGKPAQDAVFRYTLDGLVGGGLSAGQVTGPLSLERFGAAIARSGTTTVIGAPDASPDPSRAEAGAIYLSEDLGSPGARIDGAAAEDHFGSVVAACGDLDGDGVDDWVSAAPWAAELAGTVTIGPMSPMVDREASDLLTFTGPEPTAGFGRALRCGALEGGTVQALVIGAPFADRGGFSGGAGGVYVYTTFTRLAKPAVTLEPPSEDAFFGMSLTLGNLDGDGNADLAVGAPGAFDGAGAVFVYFDEALQAGIGTGAVGRTLRGSELAGRFGTTVEAADVDGDGVDELLVGAPGADPTGVGSTTIQAGALYLFDGDGFEEGGTAESWPLVLFANLAQTTWEREEACLRTGERLTTSDLDDDGAQDLVLLERGATE